MPIWGRGGGWVQWNYKLSFSLLVRQSFFRVHVESELPHSLVTAQLRGSWASLMILLGRLALTMITVGLPVITAGHPVISHHLQSVVEADCLGGMEEDGHISSSSWPGALEGRFTKLVLGLFQV